MGIKWEKYGKMPLKWAFLGCTKWKILGENHGKSPVNGGLYLGKHLSFAGELSRHVTDYQILPEGFSGFKGSPKQDDSVTDHGQFDQVSNPDFAIKNTAS